MPVFAPEGGNDINQHAIASKQDIVMPGGSPIGADNLHPLFIGKIS